ncbi:MAG: short-chain dehydrogenase, partial [Acidimicrobiia bacterium]|nr:short-chain dehydrogenase [Acidimicrobiia bacterium]
LTVDGYEMTIATNHLGPFLLTELLMPALTTHAPSRVINVASSGHVYAEDGIRLDDLQFERKKFSQREVYGHSKLANILHVRELDRRYADRGVTAYAVHPGVVRTQFGAGGDSWIIGFGMKLIGWRFRSPEEGAETSVWAATEPGIESMSGGYFADSAPSKSTRHAKDDEAAQALWDLSEALVGLSSAES